MLTSTTRPSFLLLAAILFLAGCSSSARPIESPIAVPVRVAEVTLSENPLPVRSVGSLQPAASARMAFKIAGPIESILVEEGDRVHAGQVLARLAMTEIDATVSQADAGFRKAVRDSDRMERLYADSVVTLSQYQDSQTALEVARASFQSARFNRAYAEIVAPSPGRVLKRFVEPHEQIAPGSPVLELGFESGWIVRTGLPDIDVVRIEVGDRAEIQFDAIPDQSIEALVSEVGEQADSRSGTFEIEVTLLAPPPQLRSGFIASIDIYPHGEQLQRLTPVDALVQASGRKGSVFVVDPESGIARQRQIAMGALVGESVVVATGLDPGELVVTDGAPYLADGAAVTIVD